MDESQWHAVDAYITGKLSPSDEALTAALHNSDKADLPSINVAPNQGQLLRLLAIAINARTILEIGTLGGYSTIWLAGALPADGQLVTLEINPKHADVARQNIANAGLSDRVEVRVGDAIEILAQLSEEIRPPFDLIFIDADKESSVDYFNRALQLSRKGSMIIIDNVVRDGEVINQDSADPRVQGIRRLYDRIADEPRVQATAIQTVGSKGYDGFAIVIVTA